MSMNGVQGAVSSTVGQWAPGAGLGATAPRGTQGPDAGGATQSDSLDFISAVAASPQPIDAKKVQAIRDLIGSGAYPIDARTIAAKMIALDLH